MPAEVEELLIGMFLEFCPGGDLSCLMRKGDKMIGSGGRLGGKGSESGDVELIAEKDLWSLFYCLALVVAVVQRGTEDEASETVFHGRSVMDMVHYTFALARRYIASERRLFQY